MLFFDLKIFNFIIVFISHVSNYMFQKHMVLMLCMPRDALVFHLLWYHVLSQVSSSWSLKWVSLDFLFLQCWALGFLHELSSPFLLCLLILASELSTLRIFSSSSFRHSPPMPHRGRAESHLFLAILLSLLCSLSLKGGLPSIKLSTPKSRLLYLH